MARGHLKAILVGVSLIGLAGCMNDTVGASVNEGDFGGPTANNLAVETGQLNYVIDLSKRFASQVPDTVNFAFDSHYLDGQAQEILRKQAAWIKRFPEVRFRVYGYTDEVGSEHYNYGLGLRRAQAVVNFLVGQGISRSRLQAVVSYGKTRPLVDVPTRERQNRRAITDVSGFVKNAPLVLDGKYAEIVYRSYITSAEPAPATSTSSGSTGSTGASGGTTAPSGG
ncbi:OmpA family protein [Solirhodobacter olei]|uniref:OmpA family protein n=1 Tax=Solirhodobacter olei TaxID=2493082 RepID=UPI000FD85565|nr:OmpA family protein [Solirhodobacter olei]